MRSPENTGRRVGVLLLCQLAGLIVPFVLLRPVMTTSTFLANAAGSSLQIKLGVFLLFLNGAVTIAIAISAMPVFREYSYSLALWLLAFSVIWFSQQAMDNSHILGMLSLSQESAKATTTNADLFPALGIMAASTRKWVHYTELSMIDVWMFLFYGILFRFALIPRALSIFGLLTVASHTVGITIPLFAGVPMVGMMGVPLAFSHAAAGLWIIVKGFYYRTAVDA